jgi:O-antigen/teichoic acid export membrane protein
MKIRPYIVTGAAALVAGSALAVLVLTHDPYQAENAVRGLFWVSLCLCAWMLVATLLLLIRRTLACALWCSVPAVAAAAALIAYDRGHAVPLWLLGAVILATLALTEYVRRRVSLHS